MLEDIIGTVFPIVVIIFLLIAAIFSFRKQEDAWVEIAKTQAKKSKEREYNQLCEVLKPFLGKKVKVHGMLFIRISNNEEKGRYTICDSFIMNSSEENVPISVENIKVKASEEFFKKKLEGHSREYFEFKGIFSKQEHKSIKTIELELISVRKLSRTERKRIQQMN